MTVNFKQTPSNTRTPLFYAELDPSNANTGQAAQPTLIISQKLATGLAAANVPILCAGPSDAINQGGVGSMLAIMAAAYIQNDPQAQVWLLPLADDPGAVKATGTIVVGGAPTAGGTISLYIGGTLVTLPVTAGQSTTSIATALAAAINLNTNLPVTAATTASTVTLTANNGGLAGNDIDLRLNYLGSASGQAMPLGLTLTLTAMASGATNPSLTAGIGALGDQPYDFIVSPYNDNASATALTTLMASRWAPSAQIYGHVFGAYRGTYGAQATFGTALNDPHSTFLGFFDSPSWSPAIAASVAGAAAQSLKADPALPLQTLPIVGVLAPPIQSQLVQSQRNALLYDGVSTFTVGQDGTCRIEALITTYQKNAFGQPDNSYLHVETLFTLMAVIRQLQSVVITKFARCKLAANGTRLPAGSNAITPNVIRAEIIAQYQAMEGDLVQDSADFATNLVVEQDAVNKNRVNVLYPAELIDQLNIFATLVQFTN